MSDWPRWRQVLVYTLAAIGGLAVLWVVVQLALIALTLFLWANDGRMWFS